MAKKSHKNSPFASANPNTANVGECVFDRKLARRDAKQLGLNKGDLSNAIKEVISTLTAAGFEAYIVGGGVRDALLGLQPKDFDAVTNATPNQVKEVFGKRCRIIGRRFLLCHVYSGRDMIEVATFRAPPKDDNHLTEDGMIMRDNVWGDIFQDVVRRDFSINALYYQPFDGFVYDFCGGLADVSSRTIRLLGDTQKRVEEDPVRLLRALRFKAKLGFDFDPALDAQFNADNWRLLSQVSPHRLYDETQKMFIGGYLMPLLPILFDYGAFDHLLFYPPKLITPLIHQVTINTDKRIASGKSINPAFFYAALLWENYLYLLEKFKKNAPFVEAQSQAANKVMDRQRVHTAMPKFAEQFIKDIWLMQPRLAEPRKKNLVKLFENPRFRAAYDFLLLREQVEARNHALQAERGEPVTLDREPTNGMGHWWAWFQTLNAKQQQQAIEEFDLDAVRLRFANVVNNDTQASDSLDQTAPATGNSRRERRHNPMRHSDYANDNHLTEQEQQEKDQLQQLSLANGHRVSQKPAQPLWGTPFNHRVAETEAMASPHQTDTAKSSPIDEVSDAQSRQPSRTRQTTSESSDTAHSSNNRQRRKKPVSSERQLAQVPVARRRRVPSSVLSVAEQRQIAENMAQSTQAVVDVAANQVVTTAVADQLVDNPVTSTQTPAKKRTRKKVTPTHVKVDSENLTVVPTADDTVPKRRTRTRKAVTSTNVEDTNLSQNSEETTLPEKPKRQRRAPKVSAKTTDSVADKYVSEAQSNATDANTTGVEPISQLVTTPAKKPPAKRTRKRASNAKPTAPDDVSAAESGDSE